MTTLSMREFLTAGVHFGHQTRRWNPKMKGYIFGERNGIHIIDLQKTVKQAQNACQFLLKTTGEGRRVLFVGTKKQAQDIVAESAQRAGQFYVTNRWMGGTLTNFKTIKSSVDRLRKLEEILEKKEDEGRSKRELLQIDREREKLEAALGGIKDMKKVPGALFVIDPLKEKIAVHEANLLHIPVIGITDTNCNPDNIQYVVPGNDDALRSIQLFCNLVADTCLEGAKIYEERAREEGAKPKVPLKDERVAIERVTFIEGSSGEASATPGGTVAVNYEQDIFGKEGEKPEAKVPQKVTPVKKEKKGKK